MSFFNLEPIVEELSETHIVTDSSQVAIEQNVKKHAIVNLKYLLRVETWLVGYKWIWSNQTRPTWQCTEAPPSGNMQHVRRTEGGSEWLGRGGGEGYCERRKEVSRTSSWRALQVILKSWQSFKCLSRVVPWSIHALEKLLLKHGEWPEGRQK